MSTLRPTIDLSLEELTRLLSTLRRNKKRATTLSTKPPILVKELVFHQPIRILVFFAPRVEETIDVVKKRN